MAATPDIHHRNIRNVFVAAFAVAACGRGFWIAALMFAPEEAWALIGDFPVQRVLAVTPGAVTVEGTKCYLEAVTVEGNATWRSLEPPGTVIESGIGVVHREPGCITQIFVNVYPPEVLESEATVWVLNGVERPIADSDGNPREGVPRGWITEPFTIER
jgi:hypothetical protein